MSDPSTLRALDGFEGTLARRTYLSLREAIVALRIPPGAALRKAEIGAHLGVSRSPVSEAIARLAAEGLVDVVPQAGSFVARLSLPDLREGAFLREAIELAAIEHVAARVDDALLADLDRNLRMQSVQVEAGDFTGFYELDAKMHNRLLAATGFPRLAIVADTAWIQVDRARRLILPVGDRVAETLEEHRAIAAALHARDPAAARAALRHHLRQLMRFLEPLERSRPDLFHPKDRP